MAQLYAGAEWIGPAHSENYFVGRIGYGSNDSGKQYTIQGIGLHHTATTLQGAIDTFKAAPASGKQHSAHFIVDLDGARYQMLDTDDTAFALGVPEGNSSTVNIEIVQTWDFGANVKTSDFTDAQYASVHDICRIVAADNGWPPDADHIHGHNFWIQTACPGDLDIARIIAGTGGDTMTPEDVKGVILAAVHGTGQWAIVNQAQVDAWAAEYPAKNLDAIISVVVNTPAALKWKATIAVGAQGPPGPPGPAGAPGANPDPAAVAAHLKVVAQ